MFLWFLSQAIFAWLWTGWILTHFELILAKSQWFVSLSYTDSSSSLLIFSQVVLNDCQLEDGFRLVSMLLGEGWARNISVILLCFRVNFVLASLLCSSSWSSLKVQRTLEGRSLSLSLIESVSSLQSHQKVGPKLLVYLFPSPGIQLIFINIIYNIHEGCLQRLGEEKADTSPMVLPHSFPYCPTFLCLLPSWCLVQGKSSINMYQQTTPSLDLPQPPSKVSPFLKVEREAVLDRRRGFACVLSCSVVYDSFWPCGL